jgi:hypothetical protein
MLGPHGHFKLNKYCYCAVSCMIFPSLNDHIAPFSLPTKNPEALLILWPRPVEQALHEPARQ